MSPSQPAAVLLVVALAVSALAGEKENQPDIELLEFLGTYQTAAGKEIDPLLLEEAPADKKVRGKPPRGEKTAKPDKMGKDDSLRKQNK